MIPAPDPESGKPPYQLTLEACVRSIRGLLAIAKLEMPKGYYAFDSRVLYAEQTIRKIEEKWLPPRPARKAKGRR